MHLNFVILQEEWNRKIMSAGNINPHWCFSFFKILPPKTSKFFVLSIIKYILSASLKQIKTAFQSFCLLEV